MISRATNVTIVIECSALTAFFVCVFLLRPAILTHSTAVYTALQKFAWNFPHPLLTGSDELFATSLTNFDCCFLDRFQ